MELDMTAQNSAFRICDALPFEIQNLKRRIVS